MMTRSVKVYIRLVGSMPLVPDAFFVMQETAIPKKAKYKKLLLHTIYNSSYYGEIVDSNTNKNVMQYLYLPNLITIL